MKEKLSNMLGLYLMDYTDGKLNMFSRIFIYILIFFPVVRNQIKLLIESQKILELLKNKDLNIQRYCDANK